MAARQALVCFCVSLLFATLQQRTDALLPETSYTSRYVLLGEYTRWVINGSATDQCNYTKAVEDGGRSATGGSSASVIAMQEAGNSVVFTLPGLYYHQCPAPINDSTAINEFRVVTAQHKVAICSSNCTRDMQVNKGDVVYWTTQFDNDTEDCSTIIMATTDCSVQKYYQTATGLQEGYYFDEPGVYRIYCTRNYTSCNQQSTASALLTITVQALVTRLSYNELVYSHAGVMAVAFGLLLPVGSLLANYKLVVCHIILQICGQILSLIGFVLALVYQQLNNRPHFSQVHSIVGLCLIFMVVILQPILKLISLKFLKKQVNVWHKRLGVASIFIGLCNILIGMLLLDETPLYVKILYGVWLAIVIAVFVISGAITRDDDKQDEYEMTKAVHWKSKEDRISLSPPTGAFGPSKLSKEIINERSFVQIRKKSVDVLESPFDTNLPANSARQRKISNVHFGPVVAEQLSPVPVTPNNISNTNFGFGEKSKYTDESDDSNDKGEDITDGGESSSSGSDSSDSSRSSTPDERPPSPLVKKHSINKSLESISSLPSNGGSLRITRHSSRAHTKASEVFQRSNSVSRPNHLAPSISINSASPLLTSPPSEYPRLSPKAVTPMSITSEDEQLQPNRCPFTRSAHSDSVLPLHQRRQRRTGLEMQVPKPSDNLSINRVTPARSPSRSPSFSRKRREMLVDNTLRSVMQMSDDAIVSANAQGEIVFWSSGAMKIFGYTPGEAIGSSLQMVMPQRYKEKHQNGVNRRTDFALDYIKKHNTAPEEQKHARLYAVHGVSKSGKEFGVEVVVSSFVVEGEIFYTGIITETDKGLTRQLSSTSLSSDAEIREKQQKAIAIGTQMKIAHKLQSADHMTKNELQNMLDCSLKASEFEVPAEDLSKMVDGILQAADRDECDMITFTELIDLLAKNRLYISESGVIAKYGKSKTEGNLSFGQQMISKFASFFTSNLSSIVWVGIYMMVSVMILLGVVLSSERKGWERFAYDGTGPLLSFNCVLILLMTLKGFPYSLRGNFFIVRAFPLHSMVSLHILSFSVVLFLSLLHILGHMCAFAFDGDYNETISDRRDHFTARLETSISPLISGLILCLVIVITTCFSLPFLRKLCKFRGFYGTHWVAAVLFYLLLIIHGNRHFNLSFWKWLLPVLMLFVLDRLYLLFVLKSDAVEITKAFAYDDYSRTTYIEVKKPKRFKFIPGQWMHINIPQIGYFNWQPCHISSSNKEESVKVFLPHNGNHWLKACYANFKANALNPKPKEGQTEVVMPPIQGHIRGPFGCGTQLLFNYQVAMLVCGNDGPNIARSVIQTFLEYRRSNTCHCGCHPKLTKLYFIWVIPSGNDFEWFTDFLSDIIEDKHIQRYLDIRIYLTNINSPPDELASALLQLALKTGGPALSVKRPSQPQLSKLHSNTSYGAPDFESLLDFVSMQQGTASEDQEVECGVFTVGNIPYSMETNLRQSCHVCSKKRGPSPNNEMEVTSPYRRKLSTDDKSPSPLEQTPAEWHISFQLHKLVS